MAFASGPDAAMTGALRRDPVLPPGFTLVTLREAGDAFGHARAIASASGAGTLVWVRRFDLIELAVVLEPDAPLLQARLAHYLGMNAAADMLAAHCPPERAVSFRWPDTLVYDAGGIGAGRSAWPDGTAPDAVPDWLVFGLVLRRAFVREVALEERARAIALEEDGFDTVDPVDLVESFARHLLRGVHDWTTRGPKSVAARFLERLEPTPGNRRGIAPDGSLIETGSDGESRHDLAEALQASDAIDPATGEPRL